MTYVPDIDWSDKRQVLNAVIANGENLQFAGLELRFQYPQVLSWLSFYWDKMALGY